MLTTPVSSVYGTLGHPFRASLNTAPNATYPSGDDLDLSLLVSIILSSMGVLGNALVCLVMLRHRKVFHSTTNKLIIHQSFVDFLASVVFVVRRLAVAAPPVPDTFLGGLYCRVWWSEWPMYGMFVTSTYNLVAISSERYLATCHPVRHRNAFSPWRLKLVMAAPWVAGWVPAAHLTLVCHHDRESLDCAAAWPSIESQAVVGVVIFAHEIVVPLAVMVYAYTRIIWTLHRRSRVRQGENNGVAREMFSRANRNVTLTLIVVALFFAACWLPTDIYYLLFNLNLHGNFVGDGVYQAMSVVVVLNLCVNPFIYCFAYERFRRQLRATFSGRRCRARRVADDDTTAGETRASAVAVDRRAAPGVNAKTAAKSCEIAGPSFQTV